MFLIMKEEEEDHAQHPLLLPIFLIKYQLPNLHLYLYKLHNPHHLRLRLLLYHLLIHLLLLTNYLEHLLITQEEPEEIQIIIPDHYKWVVLYHYSEGNFFFPNFLIFLPSFFSRLFA